MPSDTGAAIAARRIYRSPAHARLQAQIVGGEEARLRVDACTVRIGVVVVGVGDAPASVQRWKKFVGFEARIPGGAVITVCDAAKPPNR